MLVSIFQLNLERMLSVFRLNHEVLVLTVLNNCQVFSFSLCHQHGEFPSICLGSCSSAPGLIHLDYYCYYSQN